MKIVRFTDECIEHHWENGSIPIPCVCVTTDTTLKLRSQCWAWNKGQRYVGKDLNITRRFRHIPRTCSKILAHIYLCKNRIMPVNEPALYKCHYRSKAQSNRLILHALYRSILLVD